MRCRECNFELSENANFCKKCGAIISETKNNFFSKIKKYKWALIGVFVIILLIIIFSIPDTKTSGNTEKGVINKITEKEQLGSYFEENLKKSVVNIICSTKDDVYFDNAETGGSGTMISPTGVVMTNFHIMPYEKQGDLDNIRCMIILSEPKLGSPAEAYIAKPMVFLDLSKKYDLAFLDIISSYTDKDGYAYGDYEKDFAIYDNSACVDKGDPILGEKIRIFGFPSVSGGKALTITDGLISSFDDNEDIVTSAKIDSGNSGGLAVDQNGCIVGVPSAVTVGNYENLGIVISVNNVNKFLKEFREKNDLEKTFNISFE